MQGKMQKFFLSFSFLIIQTLFFAAFANASNYTTSLHDLLEDKDFSIELQGLTPADASNFPQNIILRKSFDKNTDKEIILAFTQEYVSHCEEEFLLFLDDITGLNVKYNLTILLSAGDESSFFTIADYLHPYGTKIFTTSLTDTNVKCAIVIQEKESEFHEIISGGSGEVSPLWLIKDLKTSCAQNNERFFIPNSVAFLYRLRLIDNNKKVSSFLTQSIPAAGITAGYKPSDFKILKSFLLLQDEKKDESDSQTWDRHYSYIHIPVINLEFWINETFFVFCFIIFSFFIIFFISFSSFSRTKKNIAILKDLFRTWYMIPFIIIVTTFVLQQTQHFFLSVTDNPILLIAYKIISSFIIFNILFIIQIRFSFNVSYNVSKYAIILIAAANIFLFCGIDLSFLFLFFFEFCVCYIACRTSTIFSIFISFILMLSPFVPSSLNFISASNYQALLRFASPKWQGNLLVACIIFPFEIQWQRLLIILKHRLKHFIPAIICLLIIDCVIIYTFFSGILIHSFFSEKPKTYENKPLNFEVHNEENYIDLSTTTEDFLDFNIHKLTIKQNAASTVIRYDISIESENAIPLYECNYEYIVLGKNKIFILIPDYPQSDVTLIYSSDKDIEQMITVTSYIENSDKQLLKESDTIMISSQE